MADVGSISAGSATFGAAVGAIITGFFAWLSQKARGGADIEVAVVAEWQKLNAALSERLGAVEKELADLRTRHTEEMDEMRKSHRVEMRSLRQLNEGLQRQIAQNSQSTANLLGRSPVIPSEDDDA